MRLQLACPYTQLGSHPLGTCSFFAEPRPDLTPAQPQQGKEHQLSFFRLISPALSSAVSRRQRTCCAQMPQDDVYKTGMPKFLGTSVA